MEHAVFRTGDCRLLVAGAAAPRRAPAADAGDAPFRPVQGCSLAFAWRRLDASAGAGPDGPVLVARAGVAELAVQVAGGHPRYTIRQPVGGEQFALVASGTARTAKLRLPRERP